MLAHYEFLPIFEFFFFSSLQNPNKKYFDVQTHNTQPRSRHQPFIIPSHHNHHQIICYISEIMREDEKASFLVNEVTNLVYNNSSPSSQSNFVVRQIPHLTRFHAILLSSLRNGGMDRSVSLQIVRNEPQVSEDDIVLWLLYESNKFWS